MKTKMLLTLVAGLGALTLTAFGQDAGGPPGQDGPGRGGSGGQGGPGMGGKRPMPLIIGALDANHDGVIDADEIANASAALKKLDKNGDGKLTRDEYMGKPPMRPPMDGAGGPPQDGAGGPPPQDGAGGPPPQQ
jgi:hypothetical protein